MNPKSDNGSPAFAKRAARARIASGRSTWERDVSSRGASASAQNAAAGPRS